MVPPASWRQRPAPQADTFRWAKAHHSHKVLKSGLLSALSPVGESKPGPFKSHFSGSPSSGSPGSGKSRLRKSWLRKSPGRRSPGVGLETPLSGTGLKKVEWRMWVQTLTPQEEGPGFEVPPPTSAHTGGAVYGDLVSRPGSPTRFVRGGEPRVLRCHHLEAEPLSPWAGTAISSCPRTAPHSPPSHHRSHQRSLGLRAPDLAWIVPVASLGLRLAGGPWWGFSPS